MAARSEEMLARVTPELRAEIELAAEEERRVAGQRHPPCTPRMGIPAHQSPRQDRIDKLLELYGANGLDRLECWRRRVAQRAAAAKVIEHV
jgi:hypothetical protein